MARASVCVRGGHLVCVILTHCVRKSICDSPLIQDQKKNCYRGHFIVAAFKHDKNCPITFIPLNPLYHILLHSNSMRKSIIGKHFSGQTRVQKLIDW